MIYNLLKKKYILSTLLFLFLFISIFLNDKRFNQLAITLCIYFLIKWITDYRKCTISYLECKIRGVKKEEGYINQVLNTILDLNKHEYRYYIYLITFIFLIIHLFLKYK